jgi:hypothetical protein
LQGANGCKAAFPQPAPASTIIRVDGIKQNSAPKAPALRMWRLSRLKRVKDGNPLQKEATRYEKWTAINLPATAAQSSAP